MSIGAAGGRVETERLALVPWSEADLADFARICADPRVVRFISGGAPLSAHDVRQIHGRALRLWEIHGYGPWSATEKESGRWVGRIDLNLLEDWPGPHRWEVGFELDPSSGAAATRPRAPRPPSALPSRSPGSSGSSA